MVHVVGVNGIQSLLLMRDFSFFALEVSQLLF
jgi:hypothetical protein